MREIAKEANVTFVVEIPIVVVADPYEQLKHVVTDRLIQAHVVEIERNHVVVEMFEPLSIVGEQVFEWHVVELELAQARETLERVLFDVGETTRGVQVDAIGAHEQLRVDDVVGVEPLRLDDIFGTVRKVDLVYVGVEDVNGGVVVGRVQLGKPESACRIIDDHVFDV